MSLFDRLGRVIKGNLNDLISKAEDPEKILEQAVLEMQDNAVKMRQALATAIATQKKTEQQTITTTSNSYKTTQYSGPSMPSSCKYAVGSHCWSGPSRPPATPVAFGTDTPLTIRARL